LPPLKKPEFGLKKYNKEQMSISMALVFVVVMSQEVF
jgi:hypothetical protein